METTFYEARLTSETVKCAKQNGTVLSGTPFFTLPKKSGALINGGSGYPQKVILHRQLRLKSDIFRKSWGGLVLLLPGTRVHENCRKKVCRVPVQLSSLKQTVPLFRVV